MIRPADSAVCYTEQAFPRAKKRLAAEDADETEGRRKASQAQDFVCSFPFRGFSTSNAFAAPLRVVCVLCGQLFFGALLRAG